MKFQKGNKLAGKRGPNKVTQELRLMIEEALHKAGGVEYLVKQATENAPAFMNLVGKILPRDINVQTTQRVYVVAPEVAASMEEWSQQVQATPDETARLN